jgi:hypothetical protein
MLDPVRNHLEIFSHDICPKVFIGDQVFYNKQPCYIRDINFSENTAKLFNPNTKLIETAFIKDLKKLT